MSRTFSKVILMTLFNINELLKIIFCHINLYIATIMLILIDSLIRITVANSVFIGSEFLH